MLNDLEKKGNQMEDFTKQSDSMYNRALREPKKTAGESSWDVWSNYLFCPRLCEDCKWFSRSNSNWPFNCKGPSSRAASHESKKDGYKQYDQCISYERNEPKINNYSKEKANPIKNVEIAINKPSRLLKI